MATSDSLCPSCKTPLPDDTSYCRMCGLTTPPEGAARQEIEVNTVEAVYRSALQEAIGDDFELRGLIGLGGMGIVYGAWDVRLRRRVAIKALRYDLFPTKTLIERFYREARTVAGLRHPHIIPIYHIGEGADLVYMVMPRIEGESLKGLLEREKQLSINEATRIFTETAEALGAAHEAGVIHRDVKPDNIMLEGKRRSVQLMDFGIAKSLTAVDFTLTAMGVVIGTPHYMSPEQADGHADIDHRTDIYSLGVVAFQVLTGRLPFTGPSPQSLIAQHRTEKPPRLSSIRAEVPHQLEAIVSRCLAKRAQDRWSGAGELVTALARVPTAPGNRSGKRSQVRLVMDRAHLWISQGSHRLQILLIVLAGIVAALPTIGQSFYWDAMDFCR